MSEIRKEAFLAIGVACNTMHCETLHAHRNEPSIMLSNLCKGAFVSVPTVPQQGSILSMCCIVNLLTHSEWQTCLACQNMQTRPLTFDLIFRTLDYSECVWFTPFKGTSHADLAPNIYIYMGMNVYCFRYVFSGALLSASAFLKYVSLRLTIVVKNRLQISPWDAAIHYSGWDR